MARRAAVDTGPLRSSRDFRLLWMGQLVSLIGRQITVVALPFQVFRLTNSSLAVGMLGLVEILPLIIASISAGPIADRVDRKKLILVTETGLVVSSSLLAIGAFVHTRSLGYVYAVAALQAGLAGMNGPARSAALPSLVTPQQLPSALALNQVMYNTTLVAGPAIGGLILARLSLTWAYGIDALSFVASISAAAALRKLPPSRSKGEARPRGWKAIREGFTYIRHQRVLISTFAIDLDAMIFGMPRAVFPALALDVLRRGPGALGLMYAAPGAGALVGALSSGWITGVRRQGRAVLLSVLAWGTAIVGFGLTIHLFAVALLFLAIAGAADVFSAVFRQTILMLGVPAGLRGRVFGIHIMVVTGGPRLGDAEAGTVASLVSPLFSVVSGGAACVVGVILLALLAPELGRYERKPSG
jgi:predicted MFS family arabinose efflux permease